LDATLLSVYFVVPGAWFLVVIVVAAVVGGYPTVYCIAQIDRIPFPAAFLLSGITNPPSSVEAM
jgi:hypothetical protein